MNYRPVVADSGSIGGAVSHEFHVLADSGEDDIAFSNASDYAANVEMAEATAPATAKAPATATLQSVATPDVHSIDDVVAFFKTEATNTVKTLIVHGSNVHGSNVHGSKENPKDQEQPLVALVLRGDHVLNDIKAEKQPLVAQPLEFATDEQIKAATGTNPGSLGPKDLGLPLIVDRSAAHLTDFICGANKDGYHYSGANWDQDIGEHIVADIRNVVEGDPSPCGNGTLEIKRGIEVGHIFQLGKKYSAAMNASVLNEGGKNEILNMGCYGIGISRIVAAAIEQNHDKYGIIWSDAIAPFKIVLIPMNMHKSHRVAEVAEKLYSQLVEAGVEVLFDDRKERPGVMFNDMELIGIPHSIVIGERNLDEQLVEYKHRRSGDKEKVAIDDVLAFVTSKIS